MKYTSFYVAATNQHVGKTTCTLGLVSALQQKGIEVGYCKPVGQEFLDVEDIRVDKDALLFANLLGFKISPEMHSPVILGSGATAAFIDNPTGFHFAENIKNASKILHDKNDIVVYEGTGHAGVGSIVNLSNAQVAKMVNAPVIMIVEGGIGNTFDRLNLTCALFREKNVPILGVIVNKTLADKVEKVRYYIQKKFDQVGLKLLGVIPYEDSMAQAIMRTIVNAVKGRVAYNIDKLENTVEDIMAGSLVDANRIKGSKNILLIVGADRVNNAIHKIDLFSKVNNITTSPLSGIVATGEGELNQETIRYVESHKIPLIRTNYDTFGSVVKISKIEVKINLHTPWKIQKAISLIEENVELDYIIDKLHLKAKAR